MNSRVEDIRKRLERFDFHSNGFSEIAYLLSELDRCGKVVEAARRWYRYGNDGELSEEVREYERQKVMAQNKPADEYEKGGSK